MTGSVIIHKPRTARPSDRVSLYFSEARLICLDKSSYLELFKPVLAGGSSFQCLYCKKTTAHEHDILGKVRYEPKERKYFVSLVPTAKPKVSKKPSNLEIIPVSKPEAPKPEVKTTPRKLTGGTKVFPENVLDIPDGAKSFGKKLRDFVKKPNEDNLICAVKISNSNCIFLLKANKRNVSERSLLRKSELEETCEACDQCHFPSMGYVQSHFETRHKLSLKLKAVNNTVNKTEKVPDAKKAASQLRSEVMADAKAVKSFQCEECEIVFDSNEAMIAHENDVHARKSKTDFQCAICLQFFKSRIAFMQHKARHKKVKVRRHKCHLCPKAFLKAAHLRAHVMNHLGAKPHQCLHCNKKYSTAFALRMHRMNTHGIGEKPKCTDCGKEFYNNTRLRKHVLEVHKKDIRLACRHCGQFFLRKDNLDEHIELVHEKKISFACTMCNKSYLKEDVLQAHQRKVHGILPWNRGTDNAEVKELKCRYCVKTFAPAEMESHLRFSHGVMPLRPGSTLEFNVSEAAEALLRTLTPQPDYLLRCLTPLPLETLDEFMMDQADPLIKL